MFKTLLNTINERGISRYRLARLSNITPQDMYALLSGKRPLFPAWRKRIASALDLPEEELFPEDGESNEEK